jgi:hypothetical protein
LISARERKIKQQALDANPHATAYRRDLAAYRAFIDQVEDLTAKRDASTDADHMRYSNQLRSLKNESARLQRAFEQSKTRYLAWRSKHPIRADPDADPQVQRLQQKLTRLEQDIRQL